MFRRSVLRAASLAPARTAPGRRFISTEPPHLRGRSWKSSAARWGIAIAGLYYYNTSPVFAEEPQSNLLNPNLDALDDHDTSSLDTLTSKQSRRKEKGAQLVHTAADAVSSENASTSVTEQPLTVTDTPQPGAAELEDEAESEGAFNPETGEINWDCPCLGGMAHGPCGPQFREAFSCFVYSSEEPKGMDCIEKFQGMRDCFHEHPDVYKDEIMDDEDIDRELEVERETEQQGLTDKIAARQKADNDSGRRLLEEAAPEPKPSKTTRAPSDESKRPSQKTSKSSSASQSTVHSVSEVPAVEPIPPSAHDARGEVAES